jgi:hypothetical protein
MVLGNSGGPVLRGSDLCAIGVHVYGGDYNTASILGRYGNPVQDYLAAVDLPLVNPGQINLVPVGSDSISQKDAATGTQAKEITKLGDNVVNPTKDKVSPEFWVFDGFKEVFDVAVGIATTLGPVHGGPLGSVITPMMITAIQAVRPGPPFDMEASLQRAVLANATLLIAEGKHSTEEGWFEDITRATVGKLGCVISPPRTTIGDTFKPRTGSPFPFEAIMEAVGVKPTSATVLLNSVASEVARTFIAHGLVTSPAVARPESVLNSDTMAVSDNEAAFLENFSQAIRSPKEESFFGNFSNLIKKTSHKAINLASDATKLVNNLNVNVIGNGMKAGVDIFNEGVATGQPVLDLFGLPISPASLTKERGKFSSLLISALEC